MSSGTLTGCASPTSGTWFQGVASVSTNGIMEMGNSIDFHYTSDTTSDYSVRLSIASDSQTKLTLPKVAGELLTHTSGSAVGSSSIPVYINSSGVATAISSMYSNWTASTYTTNTTSGLTLVENTGYIYFNSLLGLGYFRLVFEVGTCTTEQWYTIGTMGIKSYSNFNMRVPTLFSSSSSSSGSCRDLLITGSEVRIYLFTATSSQSSRRFLISGLIPATAA